MSGSRVVAGRFASKRAAFSGPEKAELAVQNCWLTACRNPPTFDREGAFRSWQFLLKRRRPSKAISAGNRTMRTLISPRSIALSPGGKCGPAERNTFQQLLTFAHLNPRHWVIRPDTLMRKIVFPPILLASNCVRYKL